jgi:hypothetical protein
MNPVFLARLKSFVWRLGCVMVVAGINFLSQKLTTVGLDPAIVTIAGLLLGECTKWVTDHTNLLGARRVPPTNPTV